MKERFALLLAFLSLVLAPAAVGRGGLPEEGSHNAVAAEATERLRGCLLVRTARNGERFGADALDPLFWANTKFLLTGESHKRALECLDDFLRAAGGRSAGDTVEQALLQRDLWALLDWAAEDTSYSKERVELQSRLAEVLRRIALPEEEIRVLPDTYAVTLQSGRYASEYDPANPVRPFLPPDLLQPGGPWVCISDKPTATNHTEAFGGRSRFLVFLHLPGGRAATFRYLHELYGFSQPLSLRRRDSLTLNLEAPQIPAGTEVALVRQMNLFDSKGNLVATQITESVQIRVYHAVTPGSPYLNYITGPSSHDQDFFEFTLDRRKQPGDKALGLVAIVAGQREFSMFRNHGVDPFEASTAGPNGNPDEKPAEVLRTCVACHADSGIHSIQSREKLVPPHEEQSDPANRDPQYGAIYWETESALEWKNRRYDWGLLNGFWRAMGKPVASDKASQ